MENKRKLNTKKGISTKKILVIIFIIMLIISSTIVVYGYFTHRASVTNNINLGYNKIELNENYVPPITMEKGISFVKEPYVTNTGNVDCYVRIKSVVSDSRASEYLTIDYDETDYTYNEEDGYWYYNKALKPGESTEKLFTTVTISEDADDIVLEGFDIYVYAESVQTKENKTMQEMWNYFES